MRDSTLAAREERTASPRITNLPNRSRGEPDAPPRHVEFAISEAALLAIMVAMTLFFKQHPGPVLGDVGIEKDIQAAVLPHGWLTSALEAVSTLNWPVPAAITLGVVIIGFLFLRRWLDAAVVVIAAGMADETTYLVSQYVRRPRPSGNGIHILSVIKNTFSYPSGHVVYAVAVFGLLVYLTTQIRWKIHPALVWGIRIVLVLFLGSMGPSRLVEGEHWPSDVFAGIVFGGFWLVLSTHAYAWARHRFPRLLAPDER